VDQAVGRSRRELTRRKGNCPKYLNKRDVTPALTHPILLSDSVALDQRAVDLIEKADLMFLSTSRPKHSMDTNHRGGPPGFIRCLPSKDGPTQFVYPEYSGNRLYQSLGNMVLDSKAGFCFPDFETGDCLYVTGTAEILFGKDAAELMPRSNLVVRVTVTAIRLVASVLPFRGRTGEYSPYNPVIRYLACEQKQTRASKVDQHQNTAKLLEQVQLSPTISRFRFSLSNAATYTAGQYVTIDASEHLDFGYSHMRDDDPRSLNDDFVRTFTVSSPPGLPPHPSKSLADDEFEMTIRNVGVVTGLLFKHGLGGRERQADFEVSIKGFGGSFVVEQDKKAPVVAFIAAGVGITPLMPCLPCLRFESLRLIWTIRVADVGLAIDLLDRHQDLAQSLTLFITGEASASNKKNDALERIKKSAVRIEYRRLDQTDIESLRSEVQRWYVCTGASQRNALLQWLSGEEVVYEDYNF
jgi:NAD(P)H-flavin reductase